MSDQAPTEPGGEVLLTSLGYRQDLNRALSVVGTIALTLSDITPTASLLVIGPVVIATAGTASVWSYLIGGLIALNVALCMGELGSMFPVAGGLYSIVTRVLGKPIGFLALLDYIGQAIFLPASIALGIGTYISALFPAINTNIAAAVIMLIVTAIALVRIGLGLLLLVAFSLGLAIVLMGIGMIVLFAKHLIPQKRTPGLAAVGWIPVFSGGIVVCVGLIMTAVSLGWIAPKWMIG